MTSRHSQSALQGIDRDSTRSHVGGYGPELPAHIRYATGSQKRRYWPGSETLRNQPETPARLHLFDQSANFDLKPISSSSWVDHIYLSAYHCSEASMASPLRLFTRSICQSASKPSASAAAGTTRSKLRIMSHPGPVEISMHRKVSRRLFPYPSNA